jgi:hypothetical protein
MIWQCLQAAAKRTDGSTPLHLAAQEGHLEVVKFLVEREAEGNAKKTGGRMPLHSAAQEGHLDVVKFLVEREVEVNLKTDGLTPLHLASLNGQIQSSLVCLNSLYLPSPLPAGFMTCPYTYELLACSGCPGSSDRGPSKPPRLRVLTRQVFRSLGSSPRPPDSAKV